MDSEAKHDIKQGASREEGKRERGREGQGVFGCIHTVHAVLFCIRDEKKDNYSIHKCKEEFLITSNNDDLMISFSINSARNAQSYNVYLKPIYSYLLL